MSFWFGDFELDKERRQLLRSGEPVSLEPKAYELLSLLVERRPRALSRAQIRDAIWPRTFVSESTLAVVVNGIRHALSDDARAPRFVRTVHGFGYAFCGEARQSGDGRTGPGAAACEDPSPYPGLSAFTEREAAWFFGREAEVEALWEKIRRRKLLAVIGPSGVGKTSFLRAGVIPSRPSGWNVAYATPGTSPVSALARALVPDLAGDAEAIAELVQGVEDLKERGESGRVIAAVRRWRKVSGEALVVVDQLEELFALNAPEMQSRFASFLGRLPEETGVHVVLSLRDDFLFLCGEREGLRPVFEDLTPLTPPSSQALRRALVEPAARRGVRFEEDALVAEMVDSVVSERGALPLLAFAVSRLWEERDRERKLLTREAHERMGGVAGALAHHAEAALAQLGDEREGILREIFRNLVTAQGTLAVTDRDELLSVFGEKEAEAAAMLDGLVDARLLTEYEADSPGANHGAGLRRIEIVHESLLAHWPRLARWRTQDADGAQLRDQLRQAAHLWDERGRRDDLLWRGASYLDYRAWRARYGGGVSAVEEAFGRAMTRLAESQRRRRQAFAAVIGALLAVALTVVGIQWSRAVEARRRAQQEALAAEAAKLLAMGQAELERSRTAAVAYVTKSLELADTEAARQFAVRALQDAPPASLVPSGSGGWFVTAFSPDGEWLLSGGLQSARLYRRRGGGLIEAPVEPPPSYAGLSYGFSPRSDRLFGDRGGSISVWSLPDFREVSHRQVSPPSSLFVRSRGVVTIARIAGRDTVSWSRLDDRDSRLLGEMEPTELLDVDAKGERIAYVPPRPGMESSLFVRSLDDWRQPPRRLATHPAPIVRVTFDPTGRFVAAGDKSDRIRIWELNGRSKVPARILEGNGALDLRYSPGGRWLASAGVADTFDVSLWDLTAPAAVRPLRVPIETVLTGAWAIDPSDLWLATQQSGSIALRAIGAGFPRLIGHHGWFVDDVIFAPDGSRLFSVAAGSDGTVRAWPMSPESAGSGAVVLRAAMNIPRIVVDPTGRWMAVANTRSVLVAPVAGGGPRELTGYQAGVHFRAAAFSPDGRSLVAAPMRGPAAEKVVRVWDVESGRGRVVSALPGAGEDSVGGVNGLAFVDDTHVSASSLTAGVFVIDLRRGTTKALLPRPAAAVAFDPHGRSVFAIVKNPDELVRIAADGRTTTVFACPSCHSLALDPTGSAVASGSADGIVRIGPAIGGDPHLFFARPSAAGQRVAFSPDGRWVASSGEAPSVHLWPVPDVTRTPLHRRPYQDVLATLHSWTNLRAVKDPQSPTGWKLEPGPFAGWAKLPQR